MNLRDSVTDTEHQSLADSFPLNFPNNVYFQSSSNHQPTQPKRHSTQHSSHRPVSQQTVRLGYVHTYNDLFKIRAGSSNPSPDSLLVPLLPLHKRIKEPDTHNQPAENVFFSPRNPKQNPKYPTSSSQSQDNHPFFPYPFFPTLMKS
ncbi:hypothetical protein VTJ04DRAFT_5030 [Mycothermus thermophilus]|uniref:uncharacterized protein n=1 Tax=Humicola insolens TaxID=85995 RepID=UPI003742AE39